MGVTRVVVGLLVCVGLWVGSAEAFSVTYDQTTRMGRDVFQSKVALKDERFRLDMTAGGEETIIIHNAEGTFTVMPSEGMAMKTTLRPGQGPVRGAGDYAQYLREQRAEKIGEEAVDGKACDVYRYTDPETGEVTTAWVWQQKMFPVKLASGGMVTEITNIQIGASIPDRTFQLPDGVQVMDMGGFMGM